MIWVVPSRMYPPLASTRMVVEVEVLGRFVPILFFLAHFFLFPLNEHK